MKGLQRGVVDGQCQGLRVEFGRLLGVHAVVVVVVVQIALVQRRDAFEHAVNALFNLIRRHVAVRAALQESAIIGQDLLRIRSGPQMQLDLLLERLEGPRSSQWLGGCIGRGRRIIVGGRRRQLGRFPANDLFERLESFVDVRIAQALGVVIQVFEFDLKGFRFVLLVGVFKSVFVVVVAAAAIIIIIVLLHGGVIIVLVLVFVVGHGGGCCCCCCCRSGGG
mmetsp:Transcript_27503/g.75747  ORF Transcript_27503/g.75747 Transcript_27503/m.75747 type:complete len:222 (+) Transcript_27503:1363-2028(+)